jgi:hypothetical protein
MNKWNELDHTFLLVICIFVKIELKDLRLALMQKRIVE